MEREHVQICFSKVNINLSFTNKTLTDSAFIFKHTHPVPEFFVCFSGDFYLCTEVQKIKVSAGSCVFIGPNTPHSLEMEPNCTITRLECLMKIENHISNENLSWLYQENSVSYWKLDDTHLPLAKRIADELSITAFARKDVIAANFMLLLAHLTRTTSNSVHLSLAPKEAISKSSNEFFLMDQVSIFLDANYTKSVTIEDLASYLNVSTRQAHRIIKQTHNNSFRQQIILMRMTRAKKLLSKTNLPIYQIAEQLGYGNSTGFGKAFRLHTGTTPEAYRKEAIKLKNM